VWKISIVVFSWRIHIQSPRARAIALIFIAQRDAGGGALRAPRRCAGIPQLADVERETRCARKCDHTMRDAAALPLTRGARALSQRAPLPSPSQRLTRPVDLDNVGPTVVYTSASSIKIASIVETEGTFYVDSYVYMAWRDDRVPPSATSTTSDAWAATYWTPRPELMNGGDSDQKLASDDILYTTTAAGVAPIWAANSGGAALTQNTRTAIWVIAQMRTQATVNAVLILKRYPFDTQLLSVQIESSTSQAFDVVFIPTPGCGAGFKPRGGIDGWNITDSSAVSSLHVYATFGETFSQLTLSLGVTRLSEPLVQRYVWGVTFLVAMGVLVLCVRADEPDRLGFVQSSFLGIVSWQFILVSSTPNLGYSTRLDIFMMVAMGCGTARTRRPPNCARTTHPLTHTTYSISLTDTSSRPLFGTFNAHHAAPARCARNCDPNDPKTQPYARPTTLNQQECPTQWLLQNSY
jgi:hypothetical protein